MASDAIGEDEQSQTVLVNGTRHVVRASAATPLLWVLRESLHLTGTKYGCGMGLCGACTVLVDARAVRSCITPLAAIGARPVHTIEDRRLPVFARLRDAWAAEDVPQCGYCQPGQIASAAALLTAHPRPTTAQIDAAMDGNLCRCGTYMRIRAAIRRAIRLGSPTLAPPPTDNESS